jgi:hypothetical protein
MDALTLPRIAFIICPPCRIFGRLLALGLDVKVIDPSF